MTRAGHRQNLNRICQIKFYIGLKLVYFETVFKKTDMYMY